MCITVSDTSDKNILRLISRIYEIRDKGEQAFKKGKHSKYKADIDVIPRYVKDVKHGRIIVFKADDAFTKQWELRIKYIRIYGLAGYYIPFDTHSLSFLDTFVPKVNLGAMNARVLSDIKKIDKHRESRANFDKWFVNNYVKPYETKTQVLVLRGSAAVACVALCTLIFVNVCSYTVDQGVSADTDVETSSEVTTVTETDAPIVTMVPETIPAVTVVSDVVTTTEDISVTEEITTSVEPEISYETTTAITLQIDTSSQIVLSEKTVETDTTEMIIEDEETVDLNEVYAIVYDSIYDFEDTVTVDYILTNDDIQHVMNKVYANESEFFWLADDWGCEFFEDSAEIRFVFINDYDIDDIMDMSLELDDKIEDILSGMDDDLSDYDKYKYLHDYIVDNTVYHSSSKKNTLEHTAYGCLVEGKAVCDGYAKAFDLLVHRAGLSGGIVLGSDAFTNSDSFSHAWNYVKLDGRYYWVDVTWDDYFEAKYNDRFYRYNYFLKGDNPFLNKHILLKDDYYNSFVPTCRASY